MKAERKAPSRMHAIPSTKPFYKKRYGIVNVPAPKQTVTREKLEALVEPSRICVLTNLPGEPTTRKSLLPGDIGGVFGAIMFYYM